MKYSVFCYICKVFCTFRNIIIHGKTIIFYCHQLLFVKLVWFWWRTVAWAANLHTNTDIHMHTCANCIMKLTWDEDRILISKTALITVLLFCISYLCEVAFSALLFIKIKVSVNYKFSSSYSITNSVLIFYIMATYTNIWHTILNFEKIS